MKLKSMFYLFFSFFIVMSLSVSSVHALSKKDYRDKTNNYVIEEKYLDAVFIIGESEISPKAWIGYSARNLRFVSTSANTNIHVSTDILAPNGSQQFTLLYSQVTSVTGVLSIGGKDINLQLGVSSSSTVTITRSYNYTCPVTVEGRSVISCSVTYYPMLTGYYFDEYWLEFKQGSGYAKVLTGFWQYVRFSLQ